MQGAPPPSEPLWLVRYIASLNQSMEGLRKGCDIIEAKTALEILHTIIWYVRTYVCIYCCGCVPHTTLNKSDIVLITCPFCIECVLCSNVELHPDEDRYRRVRVSSLKFNEQVWKRECCRSFLLKSGWSEVSFPAFLNLYVQPYICTYVCTYVHACMSKGTSPTILWSTLRNALPSPSSSFIGSSGGTNLKCLLNSLNDHFVSISSAPQSLPSPTCSCPPSTTLSLPPVNPEWCEKALASMTCSPATGSDNIPSYALKVSRSLISSPVASILNSSISTSTFPLSWKCGYISPLHKGEDRDCPNNYRPISVLPACSKILEKHVKEHLSNHLESNNCLYSHPSGFRPGAFNCQPSAVLY